MENMQNGDGMGKAETLVNEHQGFKKCLEKGRRNFQEKMEQIYLKYNHPFENDITVNLEDLTYDTPKGRRSYTAFLSRQLAITPESEAGGGDTMGIEQEPQSLQINNPQLHMNSYPDSSVTEERTDHVKTLAYEHECLLTCLEKSKRNYEAKMKELYKKYNRPFENDITVNLEDLTHDTPKGNEEMKTD